VEEKEKEAKNEEKRVSTEFRMPGDKAWMRVISKEPMSKGEQIRRLKLTWGSSVEIREPDSKEK
jgi:hypothetical protein